MSIAVIGQNQFVSGFMLAGIKDVIITNENVMQAVKEIKTKKDINIVILDEQLLSGLDKHDRADIESSVTPVFVPLSTSSSQENLRYLIRKSIGVDIQ